MLLNRKNVLYVSLCSFHSIYYMWYNILYFNSFKNLYIYIRVCASVCASVFVTHRRLTTDVGVFMSLSPSSSANKPDKISTSITRNKFWVRFVRLMMVLQHSRNQIAEKRKQIRTFYKNTILFFTFRCLFCSFSTYLTWVPKKGKSRNLDHLRAQMRSVKKTSTFTAHFC